MALTLTPKQKIFVDEYLIDFNATRAYKIASPSVKSDAAARVNASKLLTKANVTEYIQKRIEERSKRVEVTQDYVLKKLFDIAEAKPTDYTQIVKTEDGPAVGIIPTEDWTPEQREAISGIKQTQFGIEIKLHDKVKVLELLGRHLGLFTDNVNLSGDMGVQIVNDVPKNTDKTD